ncbi:MAG TPA: mechanosensitive ion channel family protein [Noviherbaspirillum sp.]|uniref:mechanosensitive ion channel family protein n=1 Tax=Noviherbaspirillum sp. TaxID=1926288 RepID=UPI002B48AAB9|nr:mechanosensitive ion channel family protein [Noviherbaspirillum sp.]HJV86034.1 mechanosensitive ion channel family protein [Noviherbaspirillum sp.]
MLPDLNDLKQWGDVLRPMLRVVLIWLLAWLALAMIRKLLRALRRHIVTRGDMHGEMHDMRRLETLMNVFRYTANVVLVGMAFMLTLGEIGISITPILATAGVAGIAIGFGAQSLVKDFFTGLFLLIENQISEGDMIDAAGKSGLVERVTLRHVRMRDYDGSVHFIPNSMITTVTNRSRGYVYAVIDISVRRQENLERVFGMMNGICEDMRHNSAFGQDILGDLDTVGVEKVEDANIGLRCRMKVRPGAQWRIRREFLRRMKGALDAQEKVQSAA